MKNAAIFSGVLLLAVIGSRCNDLSPLYHYCLTKLNISEEQYSKDLEDGELSDLKMVCVSSCVREQTGFIVNGEINYEKYKKVLPKMKPNLTEAEMDELHENCMAQSKCIIAVSYETCLLYSDDEESDDEES